MIQGQGISSQTNNSLKLSWLKADKNVALAFEVSYKSMQCSIGLSCLPSFSSETYGNFLGLERKLTSGRLDVFETEAPERS